MAETPFTGLLDLPQEILLTILEYLPSHSLMSCSQAHPILRELLLQPHFLEKHVRSTLGILANDDDVINFDVVPKKFPPLMDLWYLSHNTASVGQDSCKTVSRGSIFYPLECFHHSWQTWVAQAISTKAGIFEVNHNFANVNFADQQKSNLFKSVFKLPHFVLKPLMKLALIFPKLMWKTILATHCSLHYGKPVNLQNVWYDGFQEEQRTRFDHHYCMEVLNSKAMDSPSMMAAMLILFRPDQYIVWTGVVASFPGCKFEETFAICVLDAESSIDVIRAACDLVIQSFLSNTAQQENANCQWKKQNLFPGLCYQIHQAPRKHLISCIKEVIKTLAECLGQILHNDNNFNLSFSILEPKSIQKLVKGKEVDHAIGRHSNIRTLQELDVEIQLGIYQQLDQRFHHEIMGYLFDPDVHEVLCPECSIKWFISNSVLSTCVQKVQSNSVLPLDFWPYHCLHAALSILQEFNSMLLMA